ncbi:hypothetical protein ACTFIR_011928 [Dictyostelium discoideum]
MKRKSRKQNTSSDDDELDPSLQIKTIDQEEKLHPRDIVHPKEGRGRIKRDSIISKNEQDRIKTMFHIESHEARLAVGIESSKLLSRSRKCKEEQDFFLDDAIEQELPNRY